MEKCSVDITTVGMTIEMEEEENMCGICMTSVVKRKTTCGHLYCERCLKQVLSKYGECSYCRTKLIKNDFNSLLLDNSVSVEQFTFITMLSVSMRCSPVEAYYMGCSCNWNLTELIRSI